MEKIHQLCLVDPSTQFSLVKGKIEAEGEVAFLNSPTTELLVDLSTPEEGNDDEDFQVIHKNMVDENPNETCTLH